MEGFNLHVTTHLSFSVPSKHSKTIVQNRLKERLLEAYGIHLSLHPYLWPCFDILHSQCITQRRVHNPMEKSIKFFLQQTGAWFIFMHKNNPISINECRIFFFGYYIQLLSVRANFVNVYGIDKCSFSSYLTSSSNILVKCHCYSRLHYAFTIALTV